MKRSFSPAAGLAALLAVGASFGAGATPPPPPPPEARASFEAIDRLHFLEGDWEGIESMAGGTILVAVARRVGRFGPGPDYLLIGSVNGRSVNGPYAERPPRRPLEGRDITSTSLDILTFDPIRGGYWVYAPGYFGERASSERGHDEQANFELIGPAEASWAQLLSSNRERRIHVSGDSWDETLAYIRPDGSRDPILELHLRRFAGVTQWGIVQVPGTGAQAPAGH